MDEEPAVASPGGRGEPTLPALGEAFDRASACSIGDASEVTVLFSGGIDSLLVAEAAKRICPVQLETIGVVGTPEVELARRAAEYLALPWSLHPVTPAAIRALWDRLPSEWLPPREPERSVATAVGLAIASSRRSRLLCGQGADELFLGYAHFRGLSAEAARARSEADWQRLAEAEWPRALAASAVFGRTLASPYLDPEFVQLVRRLPTRAHLPSAESKPVLRALAATRGLSGEWLRSPKRAIQYGSGVQRLVRELDRAELGARV